MSYTNFHCNFLISIELFCACMMWYFRGFDVARQITDTKEEDKDNEYETKLRNLIDENKLNRKSLTELRNRLSILFKRTSVRTFI